jgi:hypothetical protein
MFSTGLRATFAGTSAPGSPTAGDHWYDTTNNLVNVYNGTVWVTLTPQAATVATSESTSSTSYGNLTTAGPAVTLLTGTKVLVTIGAGLGNNTSGDGLAMAVAVSGATTIAAADANAAELLAAPGGFLGQLSFTFLLSGLTAGSNTFTAKYRALIAGSATFANRNIIVQAVP